MNSPAYRPDSRRVPVGVCVQMRNRDDEILMIHRTGSHGEGKWSFPGGWLIPNETPEQAVRRETWEEIGVNLRVYNFIGYTTDAHPEDLHGLTLFFHGTDWDREPRNTNPDRITEIEWWHADRLAHALRDDLFLPVVNALDKKLIPC